MEPLEKLPVDSTPMTELIIPLFEAQAAVEILLNTSVFSATLRSSRPLGENLLASIKSLTSDLSRDASGLELWKLKNLYGQFKTALLAELGTFPSFFVSQKGSHDTLTLLEQPLRMFPADLFVKAPEAAYDVVEAGKALCFECSTACGFHLFRATEAVLRRYYTLVTGGAPQPKVRNIMVYVYAMRQRKCGDDRVLAAIEQLSKLHRNPIMHPEAALTLDEAISILGMARSVVSAMLTALPSHPPTTANTPTME